MFETEPFLEGKPKDFRAFYDSFGLSMFSFNFSLYIFFSSFINLFARYLDSLYDSSSICNFADLKCLRCFPLNLIASATSSTNQSWMLFLILRSLKGANFIDYVFRFFPLGPSMRY